MRTVLPGHRRHGGAVGWLVHVARHSRIYASGMPWTPYADLDELIEELLGHWRRILGDGLAGAWIQGSFALGAGDLYSDCDWIVATRGRHTATHPRPGRLQADRRVGLSDVSNDPQLSLIHI